MDSKEFGLVFGQQITGLDDLHYGFWDDSLPEPFSGHRSQAVFERYKTYHRMVLIKPNTA